MKQVHVTGYKVDVVVDLDWDNKCQQDYDVLNLKKGDDLGIHYRNYKNRFKYENVPVYTKPYHPKEKLDYLLAKNPKLNVLMQRFNAVLSV